MSGSESGARFAPPCFPWPGSFPPPSPQPRYRPCSTTSLVLRACPTSTDHPSSLYGLQAFPMRPVAYSATGNLWISRFSRREVPYMHGFFDRAGPVHARDHACSRVAFRHINAVGDRDRSIRGSIALPARALCQRFDAPPREGRRMTRGRRGCCSFGVWLSQPLLPCRSIPAH